MLIANLAGDFASQYLDGDLAALSTAGAWFGLLMFTIQIYFDFSGYSDTVSYTHLANTDTANPRLFITELASRII